MIKAPNLQNFKLKNNHIPIFLTVVIILGIILYLLIHFLIRPKLLVNNSFKKPDNYPFTELNKQVIKSLPAQEFRKEIHIDLISRDISNITVIAVYPAPNYLDSAEALVGDTFYLKNKWFKWEIEEIRTSYVDIVDNDRHKAKENLINLVRNGHKGRNAEEEKKIVEQNNQLLDNYQNTQQGQEAFTSNEKYSFIYDKSPAGTKLKINGSEYQPDVLNVIYAAWNSDNRNLIFVDQSLDSNGISHKISKMDVENGKQSEIYKVEGDDNLIGFISKDKNLIISTKDKILYMDMNDNLTKTLINFPLVGLNNDQIYIPDLQDIDGEFFLAEIFDADYTFSKKITLYRGAWNGSSFEKQ